jgi:Zn-dependent protease
MVTLISILVLIFSVIIHEVAHGYAALWLGDRTAEYEGRLTLNPIKHIDPFGSIILPLLMAIIPGGIVFGWAKPVPFNPYNLRNRRWGEAIVAGAGPLSNILIALFFGLIIRFGASAGVLSPSFALLASIATLINLSLAIFNLVPIPPLDGSKILFSLFPLNALRYRETIEKYSFVLIIILVFFLWNLFQPLIPFLFRIVTGLNI